MLLTITEHGRFSSFVATPDFFSLSIEAFSGAEELAATMFILGAFKHCTLGIEGFSGAEELAANMLILGTFKQCLSFFGFIRVKILRTITKRT